MRQTGAVSARDHWEPDTKDWTWAIDRPCPDCGFDPGLVQPEQLPELIHENTRGWYGVLDGPDAAVRPDAHVWSPLEYACHVRDVHRLFDERVRQTLAEDDPDFTGWDQDRAAVEEKYAEQDPAVVSVELVEAAADAAAAYARVQPDQWERTGRRDDGARFTVAGLGRYHLHELVHHLWDVTPTGGGR